MSQSGVREAVQPQVFVDLMDKHWTKNLSNHSSPSLRAVWEQIAMYCNGAILKSYHPKPSKKWYILQPPTGSGKTEGAALYCSLVGQHNKANPSNRIGVLVVTRLKAQGQYMADVINRHAGRLIANVHNTDTPLGVLEMSMTEVLVITHAALVAALSGVVKGSSSRWPELTQWDCGQRKLMIIDEALSGVIEENRVTLTNLRQVISYIPQNLRTEYADCFKALTFLEQTLEGLSQSTGVIPDQIAWTERQLLSEGVALAPLREQMRSLDYDVRVLGKHSPADRNRIKERVDMVLNDAQGLLDRFALYSRKGDDHQLSSSLLLIPEDAPPCVVLDATASQSELWSLIKDRLVRPAIPKDVRNYQNVTLHVARQDGVGKRKMIETAHERIPRLLYDLQNRLSPKRKVFLCCHKDVEHVAKPYNNFFASYSVDHWNNVDGRNEWQDHDVAVIFGLPYRDTVWATNVFFACKGVQDNDWLKTPKYGDCINVRRMIQQKQLSVSVIQAINRVRCRKTIDGMGNCAPTDVFIVLPRDQDGDAVLKALTDEMPGVVVQPWSFQMDGPKVRVRKDSSHSALLALMKNCLPGEVSLSSLQARLNIGKDGLKALRKVLNNPDHPLSTELAKMGWTYLVRGRGPGSRAYLTHP